MEHVEEGRDVMFIRVASRLTVFAEKGVIFGVGDNINSERTVEFKPLRALAPVSKMNMRKHVATVATAAITSRFIIRFNKAEGGMSEITVNSREVVDRDASLGEEKKAFIGEVEKGIG